LAQDSATLPRFLRKQATGKARRAMFGSAALASVFLAAALGIAAPASGAFASDESQQLGMGGAPVPTVHRGHLDEASRQRGSGPRVPPQWSADMQIERRLMSMMFVAGTGTIHYDRPGQRRRLAYTVRNDDFTPGMLITNDDLVAALPSGMASANLTWGGDLDDDSAMCMPFLGDGRSFTDMFGWTEGAVRAGSKVVRGEACDIFAARTAHADLSVCLGADGLPREFYQSFRNGPVFSMATWFNLSNFRLGSPGDDAFRLSRACGEFFPRPRCRGSGVETLDVYRIFGPPEPPSLDNRNAGDALGDLAFVCTQAAGATYAGKQISAWKVNVSQAYGEYAWCNFDGRENRCKGAAEQMKSVGRRSAQLMGAGPCAGQCSSNEDVGSQYSFPSEAKCPTGTRPTAGGCAWSEPRLLRVIEASCLMHERGLLEACAGERGHAPFLRAAAIWEAAFASSDPALGGCPDAPANLAPPDNIFV